MKAFFFILIAGLGLLGNTGCVAPVKETSSAETAGAHATAAPAAAKTMANVSSAPKPKQASGLVLPPGNPDAFAHFAAGLSYRLNDQDEQALKHFDASAKADPAHEQLIIELAQVYLRNKESAKAVALLSKSAQRPNASGVIFAFLARAQLAQGHLNEAQAASKQAIQRSPALLDGYEAQAEIYSRNNQWADAARTLHRAAKAIPPHPGVMVALAGVYVSYLKNQPKDAEARSQAIALLDQASKMKIDSGFLWQHIGDTYASLEQPTKAAAIYNKLLSEYPDDPEARDTVDALHEKLAGVYFQAEDRTNAMKQLKALVRDNPTRYPRAWFFLGELAYTGGEINAAIDDFQNALRGDPSIEQAYYDLALAQLDAHQNEAAFASLKQARARFARTFLGEFYNGVVQAHLKDFSEAIRHFKEAEVIALATDKSKLDERFYFQFGVACERAKQAKEAEEYLQKCIDLQPGFAEALNYLGYMLADQGQQLPRARALIEKAVKLEPQNDAYLDSMGWVLFKLHQPVDALPWLLKAAKLAPEPDATVLEHLGEVYLALHQNAKAVEAWKKSYSIEPNEDVKHKLQAYSGGS